MDNPYDYYGVRERINLKSKEGKAMIGAFILAVLLMSFLAIRLYLKEDKKVENIREMDIQGIIAEIRMGNSGSRILDVELRPSRFRLDINIDVDFYEKYNIHPLDSISKRANSKIIIIYKKHGGIFQRFCELESF